MIDVVGTGMKSGARRPRRGASQAMMVDHHGPRRHGRADDSESEREATAVTDAWGIVDGYWDTRGTWHPTGEPTAAALRQAMGAVGDGPPPPPPMWFVPAGSPATLWNRCDLALEDGDTLTGIDALPVDLPLGYHDLRPLDGSVSTRLVVTPRRMPMPSRSWGWSTQLYALRSDASWGMGDLGDLAALSRWSAGLGAEVVLINPLHAAAVTLPQQPSPYFATSRRFRHVLSIHVPSAPGADALDPGEMAGLDAAGRALNASVLLDRDAVARVKMPALARIYERFCAAAPATELAAFATWRAGQEAALERFATYCTLAEHYGASWVRWPQAYRRPENGAVLAVAAAEARRVGFHVWCQWVLDGQLAGAAGNGVGLVGDLAVGFDSAGFDAWCDQDLLALGCRVGAPPDTFNASGQDWGLPPYIPWKLRAARYEPFIAALRANLHHLRGLRIDHVMGLFRLYWIPEGLGPRQGTYVRYPSGELLDLLAVEATRAGAFVVGEDLGTIEDEVRTELIDRRMLSCRVLWFEEPPPTEWPEQAMATITTHDLPTVAGVWTGADDEARRCAGLAEDPGANDWFRSRITEATGIADDAPVADAVTAIHSALAATPSLVRLAALDDACASPERPNLPGTVDEHPNWRLPLPLTLEQLVIDPLVLAVARALGAEPAVAPPAPSGP